MRRWWPLLVVTLLFAGAPRVATACSCITGFKADRAQGVSVVFTGLVTGVSRPLAFGIPCGSSSADIVSVAFDVETVYKGDLPQTVAVRTAAGGASCGYEFVAGKRYTVFATFGSSSLETNACLGNEPGEITPSEYQLPAGHPPKT